MTFPETIRAFRVFVGWRQSDLANAIPVSSESIRRWERGKAHPMPLAERRLLDVMAENGFRVTAREVVRQREAS